MRHRPADPGVLALGMMLALIATTPAAPAHAQPRPDSTHVRQAAADSLATTTAPPATPPAAKANPDTALGAGARIPGTGLRIGDGYARVLRRPGLVATANEEAPDQRLLAGPLRLYGVDGEGRLSFGPGGLAGLVWRVRRVSPNQRDYIDDQLRLAGYRRHCERLDDRRRECDWIGALALHVKSDSVSMSVEAVDASAAPTRSAQLPSAEERVMAAEMARLRPILADPTPVLDDTLSIDPAAPPGRRTPPVLIQSVPPVYDDALRSRGIAGIVRVLALVGTEGRVIYSRATSGPVELRSIAIVNVSRYRFGGYADGGRKVRFWVWIPVRFGV